MTGYCPSCGVNDAEAHMPNCKRLSPEIADSLPANSIQYGGTHYKKLKIQHWDYVEANNIPYLEACAIKYVTRWRDKGGVEDLRKAIHFIQKRIELEEIKEKTNDTK